jgi:hypothetical protein
VREQSFFAVPFDLLAMNIYGLPDNPGGKAVFSGDCMQYGNDGICEHKPDASKVPNCFIFWQTPIH